MRPKIWNSIEIFGAISDNDLNLPEDFVCSAFYDAAVQELDVVLRRLTEMTEANDLLVEQLADFTIGREINGGECLLINKLEPELAAAKAENEELVAKYNFMTGSAQQNAKEYKETKMKNNITDKIDSYFERSIDRQLEFLDYIEDHDIVLRAIIPLVETLDFYSNINSFVPVNSDDTSLIETDKGVKAKIALENIRKQLERLSDE